MIGQIIAEILQSVPETNVITNVAIGAVCSTISGVALYTVGKKNRSVTIERQPVGVRLEDAFVTRTEFAEFKGEMKSDMREIKGMFDKALTLIAERDDRLSEKIATLADNMNLRMQITADDSANRRRDIHQKINEADKRITTIEANADVSKHIGKLGGAIMAAVKKSNQPPNV